MQTINKAVTSETNTYYWSARSQRFGFGDAYLNHGFTATHAIIVDAHLCAQEIDVIFDDIFSEVI